MKKSMMILTVIGVAVLSLGITGQAFAQDPDPVVPNDMMRQGNRRSGTEGTGIPMEMNINLDGALEDILHSYMAEALGIDPSVLADGNFTEIALDLGYDLTEIRVIVKQAHTDALAQALADGVITQEVFDWLSVRGFVVLADGTATGMVGEMGRGMNAGMNDGTCDGTCLEDGIPQFDGTSQSRGHRGGNQPKQKFSKI